MMNVKCRARVILHSAFCITGLVVLVAQQPTFHTEANYVRVDVYPTVDGQPVLDLRQDEFEVLEDGKPQTPVQFEHVVIRAQSAHDVRPDPNTVAESRSLMESSRVRLFVLFLDDNHVEVSASHNIRKPLTDTLERLIGPDDLFGVMLPEMSAIDVAFARKTTTIDGILSAYWHWGERGRITTFDPVERQYNECYPGFGPSPDPRFCQDDDRGIAAEMIVRRRETRTLDALEDLARYLRGVREERKAVLVVSDGWRLFRPDQTLARRMYCEVPTGTPPTLGPGPKTALGQPPTQQAAVARVCDRDRLNLAQIDDQRHFLRLMDEANRANVSFYTIDPRGLPVFDEPLGPSPPPRLVEDANLLGSRIESLRTLAGATDGLAIVNSNDLDKGFKHILDDLTSYYLLGYYSTGKLDGKFHAITVHVKRPGVQVRARRGYLAATQAEVDAAVATTAAAEASGGGGTSEASAEARAIEAAVAPLSSVNRELPLRVQVAAGWTAGNAPVVWAVGEVPPGGDWKGGGDADVTLLRATGATLATAHATIDAGARAFRTPLLATEPLVAGEYAVRVHVRPATASGAASSETVRFALPAAPEAIGAVLIRRGPASGNKDVVTADPRFRRSEQIRVEVPTVSSVAASARLLDRTGKVLAIPVVSAVRDEADGSRWQTAQLALAPLAVGDYVIELVTGAGGAGRAGGAGGERIRTLVAFRVVP